MIKSKNLKSILLAIGFTFTLSLFISNNAFAATYTTVSGDSLYKVSQLFNTTTTNLINDNKLTNTTLNLGQVLYVSCATYTVQNGDSIYLIAQKCGITLDVLRRANNLYTDSINIGQILNIPTTTVTPILAVAPVVTTTTATYTIVSGDSLYKISQLFNTTTTNLINDNKLTNTTLNLGQVLYVSCATYTVQNGDSIYLIAQKSKITLDILRRANNLYTDSINIGQKLNIPAVPIVPIITSTKTITYTASEVDLLARLITAEAQGEPYQAQVAVGAVVVNRVKSTSFPNSINDVIYQTVNGYYQFTPVLNGWINKPADADSINAAKAALSGSDPTDGALFYYDDSITNSWLLAKTVSITIDKLIFAF